jgi:thiol-disulfide isomerase/thioredoxin
MFTTLFSKLLSFHGRSLTVAVLLVAGLMLACNTAPVQAEDIPKARHADLIDLVSKSQGKVVIINFWASWCAPCREEIPELKRLRATYGEDQLVMVGVSLDQNAFALKKFLSLQEFNYPNYHGQPDVIAAYSIMAIPRTIVYNTSGEKVLSHEGYMDGERLNRAVKLLLEEK